MIFMCSFTNDFLKGCTILHFNTLCVCPVSTLLSTNLVNIMNLLTWQLCNGNSCVFSVEMGHFPHASNPFILIHLYFFTYQVFPCSLPPFLLEMWLFNWYFYNIGLAKKFVQVFSKAWMKFLVSPIKPVTYICYQYFSFFYTLYLHLRAY